MNPQLEAAWEIGQFFNQQHIEYAIIGGIAVQRWGTPRFTQDVDLSIATPLIEGSSALVHLITQHFASRIENAEEFARTARVILIQASNGINVDISLALPGYEDVMLARTLIYEIEPDKTIRICSAEDLIIHKAVAGRPQDMRDIEGIIYRHGEKLNITEIRYWLEQFALILDNQEVQMRFEHIWQSYQDS
jgi:hypothetical protein